MVKGTGVGRVVMALVCLGAIPGCSHGAPSGEAAFRARPVMARHGATVGIGVPEPVTFQHHNEKILGEVLRVFHGMTAPANE